MRVGLSSGKSASISSTLLYFARRVLADERAPPKEVGAKALALTVRRARMRAEGDFILVYTGICGRLWSKNECTFIVFDISNGVKNKVHEVLTAQPMANSEAMMGSSDSQGYKRQWQKHSVFDRKL